MATTGGSHARNQPRGGKGRFTRSPDTAERDAAACKLRSTGANYDQIAEQLGFTDRSSARRAVERALVAIVAEPAAQLRTLILGRLDLLLGEAWKVLLAEHIVVSQGRVIHDPTTGAPMRDHGPVLNAIDRVLRIEDRRCKLLGLDAPVKVEAITVDQVEAEIARLAVELGMNDNRPRVSL
jgi:hypothetical protein